MEELAAVKLVIKRSRFFAHLYHLNPGEEIQGILKSHRRLYRKANHHCYALKHTDGSLVEVARDDGEVGHPGKALLEILKKNSLEDHALVVSRVFGGIKLGVGGVTRAFREVGEAVVEHHFRKQ